MKIIPRDITNKDLKITLYKFLCNLFSKNINFHNIKITQAMIHIANHCDLSELDTNIIDFLLF